MDYVGTILYLFGAGMIIFAVIYLYNRYKDKGKMF